MDDIKVNDIYLGSSDGLDEASRDNFMNLFYIDENDYYSKIVNDGYFVIMGRKGTGKTILAHHVKDTLLLNNAYCDVKNLECFKSQQFHSLKDRNFQNGEESIFWKWVILIEMAKLLIGQKKYFLNRNKRILKKFINNICPKDGFISTQKTTENQNKQTYSINNSLKKESFSTGCGISSDISQKIGLLYSKAEYFDLLDSLENKVYNALDKDLFLIFDDLDEMSINLETESDYQKIINGLISSTCDLNSLFKKNSYKCQTIIVIREDIVDKLHSFCSNSNKRIPEKTIKLNWIISNDLLESWEHPLVKLVLHKAKASNSKFDNFTDQEMDLRLFKDKKIYKNIYHPCMWILDRTFCRPRDFIRFLNIAKDIDPNSKYISPSMVERALGEYSQWFYNEIQNEMSIHKDPNYIKDSFRLLETYKKSRFSFESIEQYFNNNLKNFPNILDLRECITFLYIFGVIGNRWEVMEKNRGKNRSKSDEKKKIYFSWAYRPDGSNLPNFSKEFVIHRGLQKKLT